MHTYIYTFRYQVYFAPGDRRNSIQLLIPGTQTNNRAALCAVRHAAEVNLVIFVVLGCH